MSAGGSKTKKQVLTFLKDFVRRESTVSFVKEVRNVAGLPKEGLEFLDENKEQLKNPLEAVLFSPTGKDARKLQKKDKQIFLRIINACRGFLHSKVVFSEYLHTLFVVYVLHGVIYDGEVAVQDTGDFFARIEYLPNVLAEYSKTDPFLLKCLYGHLEHTAKQHPIALYIHPETTQNQLKDFISRHWSEIQTLSSKEGVGVNSARTKKDMFVNDQIYKYRDKSLKEIRKILSKDAIAKDDGYISKIRLLETKKRNK